MTDPMSARFPGFDPTQPNTARMYDYWLGGKDNFAADREAAEQAIAYSPDIPRLAREGRRFLDRVVRFLAATGVRQFIDIGTGLPTQGHVHEVPPELPAAERPSSADVFCHSAVARIR